MDRRASASMCGTSYETKQSEFSGKLAGLAEIAVGGLGNGHGQTHSRHKAARQA